MGSEEAQEKKLDVVEMRFTAPSFSFVVPLILSFLLLSSLDERSHQAGQKGMKELEVQRRINIQESAVK